MSERTSPMRSLLVGAACAALSMASVAAGGNDPLGVAPAPATPPAVAEPGAEGGPGLAIRSSLGDGDLGGRECREPFFNFVRPRVA